MQGLGCCTRLSWLLFVQDLASSLLVKRASGSGTPRTAEGTPVQSPIYSIPADCAAWRCAMLNDMNGLREMNLKGIKTRTLLVSWRRAQDSPMAPVTCTLVAPPLVSPFPCCSDCISRLMEKQGGFACGVCPSHICPPPLASSPCCSDRISRLMENKGG